MSTSDNLNKDQFSDAQLSAHNAVREIALARGSYVERVSPSDVANHVHGDEKHAGSMARTLDSLVAKGSLNSHRAANANAGQGAYRTKYSLRARKISN